MIIEFFNQLSLRKDNQTVNDKNKKSFNVLRLNYLI